MADFGATFKKAREAKGISLDKIAEETRISSRFLLAIENEEFHVLPGGIFNRGFVRAYAARIGLDPEQAVVDYQRLAERQKPAEAMLPLSRRTQKKERRLYIVAAGTLLALMVVFYVVSGDAPETTNALVSEPVAPSPEISAPASAPASIPPPPPPPAPQVEEAEEEVDGLVLEIDVSEPTWIRVAVNGVPVAEEILQPGTSRRYTAEDSIDVTIGNAGGLALKLNDQVLPPLGQSGQVRTLAITPETLQEIIQ